MKKYKFLLFIPFVLLFSCSEIRTITTYGTEFGHNGGRNECIIDATSVSCFKMKKEFRKLKRNINKCNPCWLVQRDYNGVLLKEGYAMKHGNGSHHFIWFGEMISYNSAGDTISHLIDTNYNMDELLKLSKSKIQKEFRKKGSSINW